MTKNERLALIIARFQATRLTAVVLPTEDDTREEIVLAVAGQDSGSLPVDEDLPELHSRLSFERADEPEEEEAVLSRREKEQVRRDLLAYRMQQDLSAPRRGTELVLIH